MQQSKIYSFVVNDLDKEELFTPDVKYQNAVKPVYNDHPWDPKFVAIVDRWSLFRDRFMFSRSKCGLQNRGRCRQVAVNRALTVICLCHF